MPEDYTEPEMMLVPQSEVAIAPEMRGAAVGMSGVIMGVVGLLPRSAVNCGGWWWWWYWDSFLPWYAHISRLCWWLWYGSATLPPDGGKQAEQSMVGCLVVVVV